MDDTLLGDLSPAQFMRRHWQKSAHLIRQAIPAFGGVLTRRALFALAARDEVESRLVIRGAGTRSPAWTLEHGPFRSADFKGLPGTGWTLMVQGVDLHVDAASALLQRFDFIPHARLDDLMITYAVPGGGVGPHFDSYDVFLLQGPGRRQWRISTQRDLRLVPGAPLKILRNFVPQQTSVLEPGDMLYLPPSVAHDGVALTECTTYSIGFRAPTAHELADAFLQFLPDMLSVSGERYADPGRRPTRTPGRIDSGMQRQLGAMLRAVRWDRTMIGRFIGCTLSEPKANVFFDAPAEALALPGFIRLARNGGAGGTGGLRLDRRARMLYDNDRVYLNGHDIAALPSHPQLATLADRRTLAVPAGMSRATWRLLYDAYLTGALHVGPATKP